MSDIIFRGFEQYDSAPSAKEKTKADSKTLAIKVILLVLCLLLVSEAVIYLFIVPCMNPVRILWRGLNGYSERELTAVVAPVAQKNWINFSTNDARSLLGSVAGIESVQVVKRFPDRVYIQVTERTPVAMTFVSQAGRTVPVQIDKNGILFPPSQATATLSLPLISGIPVEHIPEGMRLPAKYHVLMNQIAEIRSLSQNYFAGVSEIHVVPKEYGNYELVLYPLHSRTKVLVDRQLNEEALQYMMVMLDVVNTLEKDVSTIDLRYGSVVYYPRQSEHTGKGVRLD